MPEEYPKQVRRDISTLFLRLFSVLPPFLFWFDSFLYIHCAVDLSRRFLYDDARLEPRLETGRIRMVKWNIGLRILIFAHFLYLY